MASLYPVMNAYIPVFSAFMYIYGLYIDQHLKKYAGLDRIILLVLNYQWDRATTAEELSLVLGRGAFVLLFLLDEVFVRSNMCVSP